VLLDTVFYLVRKLDASDGEELDAVVWCRFVLGRDHDAEVGVDVSNEERGCRGRNYSRVENIDARAGQTGRNGCGQEFARDSRIAGHDTDGPTTFCASRIRVTTRGQDHGGRLSEAQGEVSREFTVCQAPDPVRAK
jgi:hypothetical protein